MDIVRRCSWSFYRNSQSQCIFVGVLTRISLNVIQREEELLSYWWKEYAECSEGPQERCSSSKKLDKQLNTPEISPSAPLGEAEEERVGVPVKGGLYEVMQFSISLFVFSLYNMCLTFLWDALSNVILHFI